MLGMGYGEWRYRQLAETIATQGARLDQVTTELQTQRKAGGLEIQERCARQASIAMNALGYDRETAAESENHYNAHLNRCLVKMQRQSVVGTTNWTNKTVFDAFEGKVFASYAWHSDAVKKYSEVAPVLCEVTSLSGEKQTCKTDDEFENFVRPYME